MADFNLVPVPKVLLVQAGIFILNTLIIKKLMVDPYLQLKAKRLDYTERRDAQATARLAELHQQLADLQARRQNKLSQLSQLRQEKYAVAVSKRDQIIREATQQAEADIKVAKGKVTNEFKTACTQVDSTVRELSQEVFTKLLT